NNKYCSRLSPRRSTTIPFCLLPALSATIAWSTCSRYVLTISRINSSVFLFIVDSISPNASTSSPLKNPVTSLMNFSQIWCNIIFTRDYSFGIWFVVILFYQKDDLLFVSVLQQFYTMPDA